MSFKIKRNKISYPLSVFIAMFYKKRRLEFFSMNVNVYEAC